MIKYKFTYLLLIGFLVLSATAFAQNPIDKFKGRLQNVGGGRKAVTDGANDSLTHRSGLEDSITISFRYLDSTQLYKLDSSIGDFTKRFPIPATHIYLGNTGAAAKSLLFSPRFSSGFDPGFHAYDIYKFKLEKARFFNTTRPYSELNYQLGSRSEQIIEILHTQNLKPNWNVSFNYRLINAPGFFKNQKTNHNNYLIGSWFQSVNKRYNNYFVLLSNKIEASENGGMQDTANFLDKQDYKDRFNIPTQLGGDGAFATDFFNTKIGTGNKYKETTILLRQQYDFGKKDSLVTDSTVVPLFFPRLRFEHTFQYNRGKYLFQDNAADSEYYKKNYDTTLRKPIDTFLVKDSWKEFINDFSIYQFPDAKNLQQFIKLGVMIQNISGEFATSRKSFFNTAGHAEYRNKTKNKRYDIEANGKLYFTGLNAGDYEAHISLQGLVGKKIGYVQLGFENTSRTPSFIYDSRSSFYFMKTAIDFKKENSTHLFAAYFLPSFKLRLTGHYYLMTNYTYVSKYFQLQQEDNLFNVFQVALQKTFKIGKRWNWHTDIYLQQVIGDGPVNVPPLYTRNRIAYEGNLGFKNLDIAIGTEIRYRAPYKADAYSPILGQFYYQDSIKISNPLPDIAAYVHFRIRSFKTFFRVENLNTARTLGTSGFGFTNNNLVAPNYAMPGMQIRLGVYWGFVN